MRHDQHKHAWQVTTNDNNKFFEELVVNKETWCRTPSIHHVKVDCNKSRFAVHPCYKYPIPLVLIFYMKQSDELCYMSRQERDKILTPQTTTLIQLIFCFLLPFLTGCRFQSNNGTIDITLYNDFAKCISQLYSMAQLKVEIESLVPSYGSDSHPKTRWNQKGGLSFAWVQNLKTESFSSLNFRFFPFLVAKNMEIDFSLITFPICCFIFSLLLSQSLISR